MTILCLKVDNEELENWQLDKIYKQVYHKAVHKKQQAKKTKAKIREKILRVIIETLSAEKASAILQLVKVKPGKEVHDQLTKLALKRPDVKAGVLKQVLETEQQQQQQQEASLCDPGQESSVEDTAEQTLLEDLRNAEGDEMGQSNVSQEESVILMSPAREGDNAPFNMTVLSDERLEEYYRSFGGRSKNPRRAAMERFVQLRVVDQLVNNLPDYALTSLVHDHNIELERPGRARAAVKKIAMDNSLVLAALVDLNQNMPPHDFDRTLKKTHEKSLARLVAIRTRRVKDLREGEDFHLLPNGTPRNPILETGKQMDKTLAAIKFVQCKICLESTLNTDCARDTCERCLKERPVDDMPYTFSPENNMFPGPVPPELACLNSLEQRAISLQRTDQTIMKMKGGGTKQVGHSITFNQDTPHFVQKLPRLPPDLGVIQLVTPYRKLEMTVNRFNLENAIKWLQKNNPFYQKYCDLSYENLSHYPTDGSPVVGIPTIVVDDEPEAETELRDPIDNDDHGAAEVGHGEFFQSAVNQAVPVESTDNRISAALRSSRQACQQAQPPLTDEDQVEEMVTLNFPERGTTPVSEFTPGFFTMNYPHLFPTGAGDITLPRAGKEPKFKDWLNHLIWLPEADGSANRFAKNFFFVFHGVNMHQRRQMMGIGTIMADRVLQGKTPEEFRVLAADPDSNTLKCMSHISSTVAGSNAHIKSLRKTAIAAERAIRIVSNNTQRYNLFLTFSFPDNHMEQLHKLLPGHAEYLGKTVVPEMLDGMNPLLFISKKNDYLLRQKAINENGHIVNAFIHRKLDLLFKEVLTQHVGVLDYMIRSEFQSRSAIHFHCLARCQGVSLAELETAFTKYVDIKELRANMLDLNCTESEIKKTINDYKKEGYKLVDDDDIVADFQAKQDKVLHFATKMMGISAVNPETDPMNLAPPEGFNPHPPPTNALRTTISAVERDPNVSLDSDYRDLFQRVMLHTCRSGYCWKSSEKDKQRQFCRFRYPMSLCGYSEMQDRTVEQMTPKGLKKIHLIKRDTDKAPEGAIFMAGALKYLRNHPRSVEAIPEFLR